jgi:N-formylglutamate deformylase
MTSTLPFILHIPHSSVAIPDTARTAILLDDAALAREILRMTDMHTHDLYDAPNTERVVFPVSRLIVDPERFADDAQEPMAARGMGVIYTLTSDLTPLRQAPDAAVRQQMLDDYYHPHHARLNALAKQHLEKHNRCIVIDCHSFPARALPYEQRPENENRANIYSGAETRAEICIGTDAFHTPDWMRDSLVAFFEKAGYTVAVDTPFGGALVPGNFYRKNKNVMSVMIETRRDLYMDETTGEKTTRFDTVRRDITQAIERLRDAVKNYLR